MVLQRVSYAIVFLCLIQVAAWTHPVGVAAANDSAGAEAMQLLRDQYESTVGNFKSGIGDSLTARQLIEGKVFEEAGSRKPPPLPPDPEPTRVPSQATSYTPGTLQTPGPQEQARFFPSKTSRN